MGRVWKFGNNINTDEIIPGRYNITTDPKALVSHCFCEVRPDFSANVKPGDLVVAGENFGSGSSREHAPVAIRECGVRAVIAHSFARIFYRNAINVGLPVFISPKISAQVEDGEDFEVDLEKFCLKNPRVGRILPLQALPPFILKIFRVGGIVLFLKKGIWRIYIDRIFLKRKKHFVMGPIRGKDDLAAICEDFMG